MISLGPFLFQSEQQKPADRPKEDVLPVACVAKVPDAVSIFRVLPCPEKEIDDREE